MTVLQIFRLSLAPWGITPEQLDKLYDRMLVGMSEDKAKNYLIERCKETIGKNLTSFEKFLIG